MLSSCVDGTPPGTESLARTEPGSEWSGCAQAEDFLSLPTDISSGRKLKLLPTLEQFEGTASSSWEPGKFESG